MNRTITTLIASGLVLGSTLVATPAAHAATAPRHCWMNVSTGEVACFASFTEVVAAISGGSVPVAAGAHSLTDAQRTTIAVSPASVFILGQVWADDNYTDASITFTASTDCDTNADVDHSVSSMPSGWNDRVTSFKSYGLCATRIWENNGFTGSSYGFYVNSPNVGAAMNDRTSSIQWN